MSLFSFILGPGSSDQTVEVPMIDKTFYRIKTQTKIHEGQIMHQSDTVIKLLNRDSKSVSILKVNIENIQIALTAES